MRLFNGSPRRMTTTLALMAAALCNCSAPLKADRAYPLCVQYDTREVLFNLPGVAREQTIEDVTRRIDRYLESLLREDGVSLRKPPCNPGQHVVLDVRIDSLDAVTDSKVSWTLASASESHVKMHYAASLTSPGGKTIFEFDDGSEEDGLDDLASDVASDLRKQVHRHY